MYSKEKIKKNEKGDGTLPQNSYKLSQDLWEATLYRRTISVQRLARSFGKDRQLNILLLYYKDLSIYVCADYGEVSS